MLITILIALVIVAAVGYMLLAEEGGGLIARHRFNNRYSDASGARDDHIG